MKKKTMALVVSIVLAASCLALPLPASAAPRTIVVPDDYGTIAAAVNAASSGDIVFVRTGVYEEQTLTIRKPMSLIGEDANGTTIRLHPPKVPVNIFTQTFMVYSAAIRIEADGAKLANFTIATDGGPISITGYSNEVAGSMMNVDMVYAAGDNTKIAGNMLTRGGIRTNGSIQVISENTVQLGIECKGSKNSIVSNNAVGQGSGIVLEGAQNLVSKNIVFRSEIEVKGDLNVVSENRITNSTRGVHIYDGSNNVVYGNRIIANVFPSVGILVGMGYNNTFYANQIENNTYGATIGGNTLVPWSLIANNTLFHNNFVGNVRQVRSDWVVVGPNFFDNGTEGNYWSDYVGNDTDRDGIGDSPYLIDETRSDNYPLMFPFDIENNIVVLPSDETETLTIPILVAEIVLAAVAVAAGLALLFHFKKRKR